MRKIGFEVAAGVAIFIAFIIFVFGVLFIKNIAIKAGTYDILIQFSDVSGLERHDPVNIAGLKIGKLKSFRLDGGTVFVTAEILPEVALPKDSRAQIKSLGMVGEKYVDIIRGTSTEHLAEGDMILGESGTDLSEIGGTVEGLIEQSEHLLIQVRSTFENVFDRRTQSDIKQSLGHIKQLSETLAHNSLRMEETIKNLDGLSSMLNEMLAERRSKIETSIDNLYAASNKLDGLTSKMDRSLTSVQTLLTKIENEEGVVGKVIARDEIYDDFRHLTAELDTLVQDLKKRPQKYLNLGFIKVF